MRKFALAALVVAAVAPVSMASATTFTSETATFGATITDFDTTLSLAGFNTSLGTLTGVTIDYYYTTTVSGSTTNTQTSANTFSINTTSDATFSFSGAYSDDEDLNANSTQKYTKLGAGATAVYGTWTPSDSNSISLSGSDLAGFLTSALNIDVSTLSGYGFTGGGNNATASLSQLGSGYVTVTYAYDEAVTPPAPSVPEPASWAMMLVGFGAMGGTLRRNRRTSVTFG